MKTGVSEHLGSKELPWPEVTEEVGKLECDRSLRSFLLLKIESLFGQISLKICRTHGSLQFLFLPMLNVIYNLRYVYP